MASNKENEVSNFDAFISILKIIVLILSLSAIITLGTRVIGRIDTYNDHSKNTVIEIVKENPRNIQQNQN